MRIPEIELVKLIRLGLLALKEDYKAASDKSTTLLHAMYNGVVYGNYDLYKEAVSMFVTNMENTQAAHNRKITVREYFDRTLRSVPAIHVSAPSESEDMFAIGGGWGENDIIPAEGPDMSFTRRKSYQSRLAIMFTSDNHLEVQLMYFTVKALMVSITDELQLEFFQNLKMTGTELRFDSSSIPEHFYARGLVFDSFAEMDIPNVFRSPVFRNILFPRSNAWEAGHIGDENLTIKYDNHGEEE